EGVAHFVEIPSSRDDVVTGFQRRLGDPGSDAAPGTCDEPDLAHECLLHSFFFPGWYCSSVTCSIQSTTLPSSCSWMAMCVMAVVGPAPCQCFSPGGNQITSPGPICSIAPSQR